MLAGVHTAAHRIVCAMSGEGAPSGVEELQGQAEGGGQAQAQAQAQAPLPRAAAGAGAQVQAQESLAAAGAALAVQRTPPAGAAAPSLGDTLQACQEALRSAVGDDARAARTAQEALEKKCLEARDAARRFARVTAKWKKVFKAPDSPAPQNAPGALCFAVR